MSDDPNIPGINVPALPVSPSQEESSPPYTNQVKKTQEKASAKARTKPIRPVPTDPMADPNGYPDSYGVHKRAGDTFQVKFYIPSVAAHCARLILINQMDYESAAARLIPNRAQTEIVRLARTMEKSPHVQKALRDTLNQLGFGDDALKMYLGVLWTHFMDKNNDKRWPSAAKILGEMLSVQKRATEGRHPTPLPIQNAELGLKQMFGGEVPDPDTLNDDMLVEEEALTDDELGE